MKTKKVLGFIFIVLCICTGCRKETANEMQDNAEKQDMSESQSSVCDNSIKVAETYRDIYERAVEENALNTLEIEEEIINCLGSAGYVAVDGENQIDMVHYERVIKFCESAQNGENAEIDIVSLLSLDGFVHYYLKADKGEIKVTLVTVRWEEGFPEVTYYHEFSAYTWKYTDGGYLFIEEYHPSGYDGAPGQKGFRVMPLDKTCRELNQKYVIPIGYERNNMLVTDWNEQDYADLDFYDMYEILYYLETGSYVSYENNYNGTEYEIPKSDFEEVIQMYFQIESQEIENHTVYYTERQTYRYRARGLYDAEFPYEPYPEVIAYEEQRDGTVKLTIKAVWEKEKQDQAFFSELVVRPLEDGRYQYVSNQVIETGEKQEPVWYMPRLTDEEWEIYYGGKQE